MLNLGNTSLGSPRVAQNIPGDEGTYKTLEFAANKRRSECWSMNASYSDTWSEEFGSNYFGNRTDVAVSNFSLFGNYPTNPNETIFNVFTI